MVAAAVWCQLVGRGCGAVVEEYGVVAASPVYTKVGQRVAWPGYSLQREFAVRVVYECHITQQFPILLIYRGGVNSVG